MIRIGVLILLSLGFYSMEVFPQETKYSFPLTIDTSATYLFYLHGGIVQEKGPEAISPYYGKYEYFNILDSLESQGFKVISEVRPKGTVEIEYARKVGNQVLQLMKAGVHTNRIAIVGASLGAYIAVETAFHLKNPKLHYVLIGLCSDYVVEYYEKYKEKLPGKFLSIYEKTDQKSSCRSIFTGNNPETQFNEIMLSMGIDHAFLYKPYPEWIRPIANWMFYR